MVLGALFIIALFLIWLFLVGSVKAHDKLADKVENFKENNFKDKKENEENE
ncbi:hypothetical protein M5X00_25995 [Paenibacillus alvei]|uniref:hypothetical protein n=1 Tax=Paenibacillus alvei TaxID=44250 RepID=UPI000288C2F8|nr:hypothetical protein [Paenibacillus alvei]EJW13934.1 hypothetical protein PAV_141p00400 [Paenibacillus alvei DSM 29]MCY9542990.1 hypothetical protein [Paenibacillus alvei]MCY9707702.1 hypothetical protein [Paenibacillus alvei]MCY9757683.1 hypothetical protein [Paenibacillus alvei]MEC0082785.1 hypothetical protein [Paenibacillus alvei]